MANTKEIQRRIKSINSTKKITKAMEMVAAAKMKKATEAVLKTRTYANLSWTTVLNIAQSVNAGKHLHPLLAERKQVKREAIILFSSNRGLCGGFNVNVINKAIASIHKFGTSEKELTKKLTKQEKKDIDFIVIGKKGLAVKNRFGYNIEANFAKSDTQTNSREMVPIAKMLIDDFLSQKYDKVMVAFTNFINPVKQIPRVKQLLPINLDARNDHFGILGDDPKVGVDKDLIKKKVDKYLHDERKNTYVFKYEPSYADVLNEMLPRLIEIQLFQVALESNASEQAARMAAMHQANEAAGDLVTELKLHYNKARQASITAEIAEISAGAAAIMQ